MGNESFPNTLEDPRATIEALRGRAMVMGANDSENRQFDDIISDLNSEKIDAQEAISRAQAILESKQDYH